MAKYKTGSEAKFADTGQDDAIENEALDASLHEPDIPIHRALFVPSKQPFSAIQAHLIPSHIDDPKDYDQFGFHKDEEDEETEDELESSQERLKWLAHLEFTHGDVNEELLWSRVKPRLAKTDKLVELMKESGIPHSLRPFIWPRLCGATQKRSSSTFAYEDAVKQSSRDKPSIGVQIEKDLLRTVPNNVCFAEGSLAVDALRRVLRAVAYVFPDVGYCQGMGVVAANLLLFCPEETTFWLMAAFIEEILPANYYSHSLLGLQADERVVRQLMSKHIPEVDEALKNGDVEMSLISFNWLLTLFSSVLPMRVLLRIWDFIFLDGSVTVMRILISMLKMHEEDILSVANGPNASADLFNILAQLPSLTNNPSHLMELCFSFEFAITPESIDAMRKRQQALLMADHGMIINTNHLPSNLPKQSIRRRKLSRSRSLVQQLFERTESVDVDPKMKNVKQTELMIDLKNAVLALCSHFLESDDELDVSKFTVQADYSPESHRKDEELFLKCRPHGNKRARALIDFERQDEDELGFRKNDIITVICEKDEHCWVGEVNGLRGWFPAKFVEVVDERGKEYTVLGDEAVCLEVSELVRGKLASALRAVLQHGLRAHNILAQPAHPWTFIEEVACSNVSKNLSVVYSRLVLCTTFSLDSDGKVLSPAELLYRSVAAINVSHDRAGAHAEVKLRSLIALALNEQCLHLWWQLFCSSPDETIRKKHYHSYAFVRSPAWVQIKCDLRLLAQFSFNMNQDLELAALGSNAKIKSMIYNKKKGSIENTGEEPLKEGVRDMLIKHHLFSWDL